MHKGEQMFSKLNSLNSRFTIALLLVFVIGSILGGVALWSVLLRYAEQEITNRGLVMIDLITSVRTYTSNSVAPLLKPQQAQSATFISPMIPAYSARSVFEGFRASSAQEDLKNSIYHEAAINPTNVKDDLADEFEKALQLRMQQDDSLKQVSDYTQKNGLSYYYIARPMRVTSDTCLVCHSTPDQAPAQQIKAFGNQSGFGWKSGSVIAVQLIYVPADQVFTNTLRSFWLVMGIFLVIFALIILLINNLLGRIVVRPVLALNALANKVGDDQVSDADLLAPELARVTHQRDELGKLSQVFLQMVADVQSRTHFLKEQVKSLQIKINETQMKHEVAEIVESEFFQDLQSRAKNIREKRQAKASPSLPGGRLVIEKALDARKVGQSLDISSSPFLLSREIPLMNGEGEISRRHAEINFDPAAKQYTITDLKSLNGVKLNNVEIEPNRPYVLTPGVKIGLGSTFLLRFELLQSAPPA